MLTYRSAIILLILALATAVELGKFRWPNGAKAAVCLTYDDGLDSHLDRVAPELEARNLRATFFVPAAAESLGTRLDEWRALAGRGHELGNHTMFHPCLRVSSEGEARDWLRPEHELERYSPEQYIDEVRAANTTLRAVDGKLRRTFAYSCCEFVAGGESIVDRLRPSFPAARAGGNREIVSDTKGLNLLLVPSWGVAGVSGKELIAFAQEALDAGGMAVFLFHDVGGGYAINVSSEAHSELIEWLDKNRGAVWTDTFLNVTEYVIEERKRLGWSGE